MSKDIASEVYDRIAASASKSQAVIGAERPSELEPFSWEAAKTAAVVHSVLVIAFGILLYCLNRRESQIREAWILWVIIDGPVGLVFLATHSIICMLLSPQGANTINFLCAAQFIILGSTQYAIIFGSLCRKSIESQPSEVSCVEAKEFVPREWVTDSENPYSAPQAEA